jgi:hypothetical protein
MKKMFAKNGLIALANHYQAISLLSGEPERTLEKLIFKIPLLMILNTPSRIKVAKGSSAAFSCTRPGNDSYKG